MSRIKDETNLYLITSAFVSTELYDLYEIEEDCIPLYCFLCDTKIFNSEPEVPLGSKAFTLTSQEYNYLTSGNSKEVPCKLYISNSDITKFNGKRLDGRIIERFINRSVNRKGYNEYKIDYVRFKACNYISLDLLYDIYNQNITSFWQDIDPDDLFVNYATNHLHYFSNNKENEDNENVTVNQNTEELVEQVEQKEEFKTADDSIVKETEPVYIQGVIVDNYDEVRQLICDKYSVYYPVNVLTDIMDLIISNVKISADEILKESGLATDSEKVQKALKALPNLIKATTEISLTLTSDYEFLNSICKNSLTTDYVKVKEFAVDNTPKVNNMNNQEKPTCNSGNVLTLWSFYVNNPDACLDPKTVEIRVTEDDATCLRTVVNKINDYFADKAKINGVYMQYCMSRGIVYKELFDEHYDLKDEEGNIVKRGIPMLTCLKKLNLLPSMLLFLYTDVMDAIYWPDWRRDKNYTKPIVESQNQHQYISVVSSIVKKNWLDVYQNNTGFELPILTKESTIVLLKILEILDQRARYDYFQTHLQKGTVPAGVNTYSDSYSF